MYCKYCGQKIEDGFRFCMNCGKPVDMPAQTPEKIGPVIPVAPVVPVPVPERVKEAPAETARKEDAALEYLDKSAPQEAPKADGGADAYLEKPFNPDELRMRVAALLDQRRQLRQHFLQQLGVAATQAEGAESVEGASAQRDVAQPGQSGGTAS